MRGVIATGAVAAILVLSGCESVESEAPDAEGPTATLGFTQLIPLEGTRNALLRITNTSDSAIDVTSVAIEWPGYPDLSPSPETATITAGQILDMRLRLPDPACDEPPSDEEVVGVVETEQGTIRDTLQPTGTTYVRRLWQTQCDELAVSSVVAISYSPTWRVVGDGVDARAVGDIVLRRRDGDEPIEVESVDGSVLHDLRLPGPTRLSAGEDGARIPLEITPGYRCDEHARGQATAPFDFLMRLRIGDRRGLPFRIEVPLTAMDAATEALDVACLARGRQ